MNIPVSVLIPMLNEEANIAACLDSLREWWKSRGKNPGYISKNVVNAKKKKEKIRKRGWIP